ncbi:polysaccharide deacetylase family protein [Streptomyces cahuitamycinicus]|uniref:polysaccharide deacetylase family protein n=1 Tax=Streptomyces cahuitamycinicus TaxID=2070367 RepID=UPI0015E14478|nr:polysaccharide deacetylase family protein [Streptomyces cahuitamycinicus]
MTYQPVPVFLYHSVSADPPSWIAPFTVCPRVFAEQLDLLADSGLEVVPLRRLIAALRGGPPLPARSAVLTFDDGFADFHSTVAPLLAARGLPATLYVTTGALGGPSWPPEHGSLLPPAPMLTWRQVRELDQFVEIGGHTRTHPQLDALRRQAVQEEVRGCKARLEDALGHRVDAFAYPHGYSSRTVRRVVDEAGWTSAAAVRYGFSSGADEPLRIARLMVRTDTCRDRFLAWAQGAGAPVAPFPERVGTKAWRGYRRLRAGIDHRHPSLPTPVR